MKGADPNRKDEEDRTPLDIAATYDNLRCLIDHGADLSLARPGLLHAAISEGKLNVVKKFLKHGSDPNKVYEDLLPLSLAVHCPFKRITVVKELLAHGADPNIADRKGRTPLHEAVDELCRIGPDEDANVEVAVVKELLKHGANPSTTDNDGCNVLHDAIHHRSEVVVSGLLQHGSIDANKGDNTGVTPLFLAVKINSLPICKKLLEHGCDPNKGTSTGNTPLHIACRDTMSDLVKELLGHGADPNKGNAEGVTPVHEAAQYGAVKVLEELLSKGGDPNRTDNEGRCALHHAAMLSDGTTSEVVRLLIPLSADVSAAAGEGGDTPLHLAASSEDLDTVKALVEGGADLRKENKRGLRPIDVAIHEGNSEVARYLMTC
eukprot:TRINITY_DN13443_c0_g1_i1.p1 TRINITY_DN13443_c0_g1~~TRINITY_DN13443_c0_g1_i1.p1  ORF type:complete len:377 (+),score=103.34 TRINITY_DN13443_c0_g1_i1:220-1350(+)